MKKFILKQDVTVTAEDDTPIREFKADLRISTLGISEDSVKDMLEMYANGFTGMLEEMSFDEKPDFMADDIGKEWL